MNVEDIKDVELPEGDLLKTIFTHQRNLMESYHAIEENNVGHRIPAASYRELVDGYRTIRWQYAGGLDLNDRASQLRIKSFCWRVTEEISEATCAMGEENSVHFQEEVIDALHFLVELMCLSGIEPGELILDPPRKKHAKEPEYVRESAYLVVEKLGQMANCLKGKEWKTTMMLTDEKNFRYLARETFKEFNNFLGVCGFDKESTTLMYLRKHKVNQFRVNSRY